MSDRDALREAMAAAMHLRVSDGLWSWDDEAEDIRAEFRSAADHALNALLSHPALLGVLVGEQKPCETCGASGMVLTGAECSMGCCAYTTTCPTCHGKGTVPLVDRAQVLAALGMERVEWGTPSLHPSMTVWVETP